MAYSLNKLGLKVLEGIDYIEKGTAVTVVINNNKACIRPASDSDSVVGIALEDYIRGVDSINNFESNIISVSVTEFSTGLAGETIKAGELVSVDTNGKFKPHTEKIIGVAISNAVMGEMFQFVRLFIKEGSNGGAISKQAALWADYVAFYSTSIVKGVNDFFVSSGGYNGNALIFNEKNGEVYVIDEIIDYSKVYVLCLSFFQYLSVYQDQSSLIFPIYPNMEADNEELTKKIGVTKKLYVAIKLPYRNNLDLGVYPQQANTEKLQAVKDWITVNSPGGVFLKLNADWASYPLFKKEEFIFDVFVVALKAIAYD